MSDLTEMDSSPIWVQAIGIFQGCLLGILIPKMILGNSSNSRGVNRSIMTSNLIGNVNAADMQQMLVSEKSCFDHMSDTMFDTIDKNKDGSHSIGEVEEYLKSCSCLTKDIKDFIDQN